MSWKNAFLLWWALMWRLVVPLVLFDVIFAFIVRVVAGPHPIVCDLVGFVAWFPISILATKLAIGRYVGQVQSWKSSIRYWWSLMWRLTIYGAVIGFLLSIVVSAIVGRPSEHPGFVFLGLFVTYGPVAIIAVRQMAIVHSIGVAAPNT